MSVVVERLKGSLKSYWTWYLYEEHRYCGVWSNHQKAMKKTNSYRLKIKRIEKILNKRYNIVVDIDANDRLLFKELVE